jgi:SAM-dependent methyltransferase
VTGRTTLDNPPFHVEHLIATFEERLRRFGPTPKGLWADKNSNENLVRRFDALLGTIGASNACSLLDLGCGPGLALAYMEARGMLERIRYHGIDLSPLMIDHARQEWPQYSFEHRDITAHPLPPLAYDYTMINGVFTGKFALPYEEMEAFVTSLLHAAWHATQHALAFNVMSVHVDWERPYLFHWPVDAALSFCKTHLSRHVVVRADYGLYEYAVQVYRTPRSPSGPPPDRWLHPSLQKPRSGKG